MREEGVTLHSIIVINQVGGMQGACMHAGGGGDAALAACTPSHSSGGGEGQGACMHANWPIGAPELITLPDEWVGSA